MKRSLVIPLTCLLGMAGPARAAEPELVPIERFELANGMTFLVVDRPGAVTVSAGWVVESGSANDPDGRNGLAHLLEHLMFQGSAKLSPGELDVLYARAGATGLNAVTQRDLTAYFVNLPAEKLELWFWLESDRLLGPALGAVREEKQVVREERRLRTDAQPTGPLEEELSARFWGAHPYGRPVSGAPDDLESIERRDAREHFESHYAANHLTAVLVGSTGADSPGLRQIAEELAELYFGRLSSREVPPTPAVGGGERTPVRAEEAPTLLRSPCECRTQARILYESPRLGDPDTAALEVLVSVLNGRSGRLHRSLVLDQGLAFAAFAQQQALRDGGTLSLTAEAKSGTAADTLLAALDRELHKVRSELVPDEELAKAKIRLRADGLRALEDSSEVMMQLLMQAGSGRPEHVNWWLPAIAAVTSADVQRVARDIIVGDRRAVGLFERGADGVVSP